MCPIRAEVVVGETQTDKGRQRFSLDPGDGMVALGTPGQHESSIAHGVSADGRTIVGAQGKVAFRWTQEQGMTLARRTCRRQKPGAGDLVRRESRRRMGRHR